MNRNSSKQHLVEGPVTYDFTLHLRGCDRVGDILGQPLDTFFWALTISWSQLLARVCNDPKTNSSSLKLVPVPKCLSKGTSEMHTIHGVLFSMNEKYAYMR